MSEEVIGPPEGPSEPEQSDRSVSKASSLTELFASWVHRAPSPEADIASKMTPEHLTQSLGMVDAQNQRVFDDRTDQRKNARYYVTATVVALIVMVAMLVFSGNASLVQDLGQCLVVGGFGLAGGYGLKSRST